MEAEQKKYTNIGGPNGTPLYVLRAAKRGRIQFFEENSRKYGDLIPYRMFGRDVIQLNHPDLIRYVLVENHKNYSKSKGYIRFESVLGKGLLTSNGEKWKRDRQKMQPMFKQELVEGYYFDIINEISEKFKRLWLELTKNGPATIDLSNEMSSITLEVIVKIIFGRDDMDEQAIADLHGSYRFFMHYLKDVRLLPKVDFRKMFHTREYRHFVREMKVVEAIFERLKKGYETGVLNDKYNMLSLLVAAKKQNPEYFTDRDIRDQTFSMVFAGFETTSVVLGWMWYALDSHPDIQKKLREEMLSQAPCLNDENSASLNYDQIASMPYLSAAFQETMRLYPPLWMTGREANTPDMLGGLPVQPGTVILLPQIIMHRHPRWWESPNAFIPERFMPGLEHIDGGLFFPFSQGARKCSGYKLAEMEAKTIVAKLLSYFDIDILNAVSNRLSPGISLQSHIPFVARISRRS